MIADSFPVVKDQSIEVKGTKTSIGEPWHSDIANARQRDERAMLLYRREGTEIAVGFECGPAEFEATYYRQMQPADEAATQ